MDRLRKLRRQTGNLRPVFAAAVILDPSRPIRGLDDSKLLPPERREVLAARIKERAVAWSVAASDAFEVDQWNILQASRLAMRRAVLRLGCLPEVALIDGNQAPELPCPVETIVDGDALVPAISAASIVAKVTRDRLMRRLATRYPGYGWETNVGYATSAHREAIWQLGPCRHHRRSFAPIQGRLFD